MNETLATIAKRYSCRGYTPEKLPRETLQLIAEAAVQSPSSMNRQPWEVYCITNEALLAEMDAEALAVMQGMEDKSAYERIMQRGGTVFYGAPCMFVLAAPKDAELDCGIVSENIALAATSLSLGNVICGLAALSFMGAKGADFAQRIGFTEGSEFRMAVLVGYEQAPGNPHEPNLGKIHFVE